jgi:sugar (pentulose or hexulose) kinase
MEKKYRYVVGIDSGTSVVKVVLFDLEGREVEVSSRTTPVEEPHYGWSEFDAEVDWQQIVIAFRAMMTQSGISSDDIGAIGVCGKQGSVFLGADHKQLRRSILWNDARCTRELEEWEADGRAEATYAETSTWLLTSDRNLLLPWLRTNEPDVIEQLQTVVTPSGWINFQLTGDFGANGSDYSPQVDETRRLSRKALEIAGIADLEHAFPEIGEPGRIIGHVTEDAAAQLGIRSGIPVASMGWDALSSTSGGGAVEAGEANIILGTSGCVLVVVPEFPRGPKLGITAVHNVPGQWVQFIAPWTGTPNSDWFNDNFTFEDRVRAAQERRSPYEILDEEIAAVPAGSNGVFFHPYMNPAGERAPFRDTNARGNYFGLSFSTSRAQMLRSLYEGMAYANKHCVDVYEAPVTQVRLTGGGANSPVWCQIFADVLNVPVKRMSGTEFGAKGAAWNAAWAAGIFDTWQEASSEFCREGQTFTPDPTNAQIYADMYEVYKSLPAALEKPWEMRRQVLEQHKIAG